MGKNTLAVLRAMHRGTVSRVRVAGRESGGFGVERGVRQGSVLSPVLFVALMDWVLRVALDGRGLGVGVGEGRLMDLEFADDVLLLAETVEKAQEGVNAVAEVGRRVGLQLNAKKTVWVAQGVGG